MAYITLQDMQSRRPDETIIQLTDDKNTGSVDQDKVDVAIADADDEINLFINSQYTVPLTAPVPSKIKAISCDIAIYNLYKNRGPSEKIRTQYKDARRILEQIAARKITLPIATAPTSGIGGGVVVTSHFDE